MPIVYKISYDTINSLTRGPILYVIKIISINGSTIQQRFACTETVNTIIDYEIVYFLINFKANKIDPQDLCMYSCNIINTKCIIPFSPQKKKKMYIHLLEFLLATVIEISYYMC